VRGVRYAERTVLTLHAATQGSQAYARALAKAGVLTDDEAGAIVSGLDTVAGEWEAGAFRVRRCLMRARSGGAAGGCAAVVTHWPEGLSVTLQCQVPCGSTLLCGKYENAHVG
jgi:hypothetical protein